MIIIHQFPPFLGMQSSPFGLKLETWFRMAGLPYDLNYSFTPEGPKGKFPYIEQNGKLMGDSELIIANLTAAKSIKLDHGISALETAKAVMVRRLVEDHLYFVMVHSRWLEPDGWATLKKALFDQVPFPVRKLVTRKALRSVRGNLIAQGISRHSREEIFAKGLEDIEVLSIILGDNPYFIDDTARSVDASVFGLLANILYPVIDGPLKEGVRNHKNLVEFCDRMKERYWSDGLFVAPEPQLQAA